MAVFARKFDYAIIGAGASGMSFLDTLMRSHPRRDSLRVALVDPHAQAGGHWNDDYAFVRLHQPATNYGVEGLALEDEDGVRDVPELRAPRSAILKYYERVLRQHMEGGRVEFIAKAKYDFGSGLVTDAVTKKLIGPLQCTKVVDARFTQNDVPVVVPPRFQFSPSKVDVIPVNSLVGRKGSKRHHYVVVGGGKTGQDAIMHLLKELQVAPEDIVWIVPNDFWITARDAPDRKMDTCTEFLSLANGMAAAPVSSPEFIHATFEELERRGKVYRFDQSVRPTKFMNATMNRDEVETVRRILGNINRSGRLSAIHEDGTLVFSSGETQALPWSDDVATTFVHCSCGAFNFSASSAESRPPVFGEGKEKSQVITIQEVFQYPGFCFNGSLIAKLECDETLTTKEKNAMCELPTMEAKAKPSKAPLGPSAGSIGALHIGHPLCVSSRNALRWYEHGLGEWLHNHRLYSLTMNKYSVQEGKKMVQKNVDAFAVLENAQ